MEPKKPGQHEPGAAWRYDILGYTFAGSIMLFAGAGFLLDHWVGTTPFLTIAGTLVGAGLAFAWVYVRVRQDDRASEERRHRTDRGAP